MTPTQETTETPRKETPDSDWMDRMGGCKICGGEIPHGHTDTCVIFKYEMQERELLAANAKLAEFQAITFQVVPGPNGDGVEVPCDPEFLKASLKSLEDEWNGAEKRLMEANAKLAQAQAEAAVLRSSLLLFQEWTKAVSESQHDTTEKFNARVKLLAEANRVLQQALSATAGTSLLKRLAAAEGLKKFVDSLGYDHHESCAYPDGPCDCGCDEQIQRREDALLAYEQAAKEGQAS